MPVYIEKAIKAYCDDHQTSCARDTAKQVLLEAGFTDNDLSNLLNSECEEYNLYLFAA